ncbi:hypothetical protein HU200_000519 [Digitaria exilis]|uniref:Uncharacterized protein n=1 Tax=Digitaria exilis TaxID=1010633 RepID=A0A835FYS6_9POAL|nr:hypothetical protein HU200_000519 [Digitaria exilis]
MENGGVTTDLVMCSTCSGFVYMKERTSVPKPDEEVVEVVREAEKMRDLLRAVLLHGPLQEMEPAEATKKQWQVLRRRRRIMMETKRCPTCSGSIMVETKSCPIWEEGKSCPTWKEGIEFMPVVRKRKKIATQDEEIVAELKRLMEESSGLKEKKAKSEDKEGSGSKKKAKRSSEMVQPKVEENSESAVGNRKTKMVTRRMDKDIDVLPPLRRSLFYDKYHTNIRIVDTYDAHVAAETLFIQCLQCHYRIKGYAEYQEEVTDDEGEDHKLV